MKIGVLTLPLYVNYGGILQAWALQTVLERMGHKAEVIIIKGKKNGRLKSLRTYLSPVKRFLLNIIPLVKDKHIQQDVYCRTFIKKHIKSHCFEDFDSISNNQYDAIVVGSDQIWREKYFKAAFSCPINNAFLSFISGGHVKKISFAASFGLEEWQWNVDQTEEIKKFQCHKCERIFGCRFIEKVRIMQCFTCIRSYAPIRCKRLHDIVPAKSFYIKTFDDIYPG